MTTYVELYERGGGWVAAGNAAQWSQTYDKLVDYSWACQDRYVAADPWNRDVVDADLRRAGRLVRQAWRAIHTAQQAGRMSVELYPIEADTIRIAIEEVMPISHP